MSRKERVVAAISLVIAAAGAVRRRPPAVTLRRWGFPPERLSRAAAQARSGLGERVLAGVLLAVAVAGAVLIPRLLVGPSPQHELGVGAPSTTGPPVVLAPGLPTQKSRPPAAAAPPSHASHLGIVPSANTSQPVARPRPATSPAVHGPPTRTQPEPQPPAQPATPATPHALAPTPLAAKTTSCNGTFSGTGKDVVVPSGATCVLAHGTAVTHDLTVSPGGTLIDPAVTVGHDLVAHSPAGISIDGGSVGHDLRIEGLSGSAGVQSRICDATVGHDLVVRGGLASAGRFAVGDGCPDGGNTVGHDLVVAGNANAVAVAGNSVGHDLRIAGSAPIRHVPQPPHPVRKQRPQKPQHEPQPPAPPTPQSKPRPHPGPKPKRHPDLAKPQHTPPPKPSHEAEPQGHGNGHKQ
jgi:hypothetical protein